MSEILTSVFDLLRMTPAAFHVTAMDDVVLRHCDGR